ncbi:MAG: hypothetical protein AAGF56_13050, partial [Pseudomonadota bacterium]
RTITKPTAVTQLIGELCQHGFFVWWDQYAAQVRLRSNRPLDIGENFADFSDRNTFLRGTPEISQNAKQRIGTLVFYHGQLDPTEPATDKSNYAKVLVVFSEDAADHPQEAIKTIFSPWFGRVGSDFATRIIGQRLVNRYGVAPKILSAKIGVKDVDAAQLAGLIKAETFVISDEAGFSLQEPMQISAVERMPTEIAIKAETYDFDKRYGFITENSRPDYDASSAAQIERGTYIATAADATFFDGTTPYLMF